MEFLDHFVNKIFPIKKIWGLHIWEPTDGEYEIQALLMEKISDTLYVVDRKTFQGFNQIPPDIFLNIPIALSFDSAKVLHKEIVGLDDVVLEEQFHVDSLDEFVVQNVKLANGYLASIIRKSQFENILNELRQLHANPISITFGSVSFIAGISFVTQEESISEYIFYNYKILVDGDEVGRIQRVAMGDETVINFGSEQIEGCYVIPYCNVLSTLLYGDEVPYFENSSLTGSIADYSFHRFYKILLPSCLGLLLFILMGNFFLLQYYKGKQKDLSEEYIGYQLAIKEQNTLQKQFEDHKRLIGQLESGSYGIFSYYADRIAASINNRVQLKALYINPRLVSRISNANSIVYQNNTITIEGVCQSPVELSQWIKDLNNEAFVSSIYGQTYRYDEQERIGHFLFQIKVASI